MSKLKDENGVLLETLINMFTVEKGVLKILLEKKQKDPYKGYWILPNDILKKNITLEENIEETIKRVVNTSKIYLKQDFTFSSINRNPNERIIATSYIALVDNRVLKINNDVELKWFDLEELPKIGYDHKEIIEKSRETLKKGLLTTTILKNLFPNSFTLPEVQSVFESIMNKKLDRRNFRKKILNLNLIEELGQSSVGGSGRPAKLYKFKENLKEINLF